MDRSSPAGHGLLVESAGRLGWAAPGPDGDTLAGAAMVDEWTTSAARVSTPTGQVIGIPEGKRLVFGRGPDADLTLDAGRGLSRRAGLIAAVNGGAWVANISCTHALYAVSDGCRIRLPRMEVRGEPVGGWFVRSGTVLVGSRTMLDEGQSLRVAVGDGPVGSLVGERRA